MMMTLSAVSIRKPNASVSERDADRAATSRNVAEVSPWRARSRDQQGEIGLAILGCFLDFPDLLDDPTTEEAIRHLEGETALAAAAISSRFGSIHRHVGSQEAGQEINADALEILAQLPASIHTFAAERLASPVHEHREDARLELVKNTQKLKELGFTRHETQVIEALHRIDRTGDPTGGDLLLRELVRRAREKRGLREG